MFADTKKNILGLPAALLILAAIVVSAQAGDAVLGQCLAAPEVAPSSLNLHAEYREGEVLVDFVDNATAADKDAAMKKVGAVSREAISRHLGIEAFRLKPGMRVKDAEALLDQEPSVEDAEPDYAIYADQSGVELIDPHRVRGFAKKASADPLFGLQWGLHNTGQNIGWGAGVAGIDIHAAAAWVTTTGSAAVVVGVIDTGVDYTHPDIRDNMWRNPGEIPNNGLDDDHNGYVDDVYGIDTFNHDSDPMDDNGHGTHVAGIIAARGDNGIGVAGVNWRAKIVACKCIDSNNVGSMKGAIACLSYFYDLKVRHGVNLVLTNNSWGGHPRSSAREAAIVAHKNAGILFVAAAGNSGANNDAKPYCPASHKVDNVIAVTAVDQRGKLLPTFSYGESTVATAAPGVRIASTYPHGRYAYMSGTSMAVPAISGMLALYKAKNPSLTWLQLKKKLLASGRSLPSLAGKTITGKMATIGFLPDGDGDGIPDLNDVFPQIWLPLVL